MDSRQIEIFVIVAETLNLREAGRALAISQPAISMQLQALESELGFPLLVREKQRVTRLTPAGREYLDAARDLLAGLRNAARGAAGLAAGKSAVVKVGIAEEVSWASDFWIAFRACQTAHPYISFQLVELTLNELAPAVASGALDMALTLGRLSTDGLRVTSLWSQGWAVVLPKGHALSSMAELGPSDLEHVPLVLGDAAQSSGGHRLIEEAFARERRVPQVSMRAARRSTMLMLVGSGVAATFMPASIAAMGLPGMDAVAFRAEPFTVAAISRRGDASAALQAFWTAFLAATTGTDFTGPQAIDTARAVR